MTKLAVLALAFTLGPCSTESTTSAPAPSATPPGQAIPVAAAAPTTATPVAAAPNAAAHHPGPAAHAGGCAQLAQMCPKCQTAIVKSACNTALTAGSLDPKACDDGLRDPDIQRLCGGGGAPAPTTTTPAPTPAPAGGNPCAQLGAMCPKCQTRIVKSACNTALTAGTLDPRACQDGLRDPDIQRLCK